MRSFKEYYDMGLADELAWLKEQETEWWKKKNESFWMDIRGKYPEGTKFLSNEERNDVSLFHNHTNVKNSEWSILFFMLGQALVDWCFEKGAFWDELCSYSFFMERKDEGISLRYKVKRYAPDQTWEVETDEDRLKCFEGLDVFLKDMVLWLFDNHKGDIPLGWNWFSFGLDSLATSVKFGEWVPASDGSMNLGFYVPEKKQYVDYVECM